MGIAAYILIILVIILSLWLLFPYILARIMRGKTTPDFSPLLNRQHDADGRYLLYFWSPHCAMCKGMSKIIDELKLTYDNIIKVDTTQEQTTAIQFRIIGTPSIVIVNQGKIETMLVGFKSKGQLVELLENTG